MSIISLKMTAEDGKKRLTDVADTEQLLRLLNFLRELLQRIPNQCNGQIRRPRFTYNSYRPLPWQDGMCMFACNKGVSIMYQVLERLSGEKVKFIPIEGCGEKTMKAYFRAESQNQSVIFGLVKRLCKWYNSGVQCL